MNTGLGGRSVIVTGATAHIGRAITFAFAAEGAKLALVGRDEAAGATVADLILARCAADASWLRADVTDEDDVARIVDRTRARFGGPDAVVNNVGGNVAMGPFVDSQVADWRADVELNLISTTPCTQAVLPLMI